MLNPNAYKKHGIMSPNFPYISVFFSAEFKESRNKFSHMIFLHQKNSFLEARGHLGRPWGTFRHRGSIFDDFSEAFLETCGNHGPSFGLQGGPALGIFRSLGRHFAAPGRHRRQHAVRTLFLPSPGEEKVRILGVPDVAYI